VFEHITTRQAVQFVHAAGPRVAATITAHHLLLNRNAMFAGGMRPHHYCLPLLKREEHRQALVAAATSGNPKFFLGTDYPDYHPAAPGGLPGGRAVCAEPFDGRELGDALRHLKPPARELTLFGIKVGSGPDFRHFANAQRSLRSALYVAKRVLIHFVQVAAYGRDVTLMSGNALVGRLLKTALDLEVRIQRSTAATELILTGGRVTGATAVESGTPFAISARCGVVCAAGGFSHDVARRKKLFPQSTASGEYYSLASRGNTGDGLRMAEAAGAAVEESFANPAAWMPVSRVPYPDGSFGIYPHTFDRGKPGVGDIKARNQANGVQLWLVSNEEARVPRPLVSITREGQSVQSGEKIGGRKGSLSPQAGGDGSLIAVS